MENPIKDGDEWCAQLLVKNKAVGKYHNPNDGCVASLHIGVRVNAIVYNNVRSYLKQFERKYVQGRRSNVAYPCIDTLGGLLVG
eukprot:5625185-Pyramimonas_sp.AAC.1